MDDFFMGYYRQPATDVMPTDAKGGGVFTGRGFHYVTRVLRQRQEVHDRLRRAASLPYDEMRGEWLLRRMLDTAHEATDAQAWRYRPILATIVREFRRQARA